MITKLFLFDCDETLWHSDGADFISSVKSKLISVGRSKLLREFDGKEFVLKKDVPQVLEKIKRESPFWQIGIISDNLPGPVEKALRLFGLWGYINPVAVNVRLWKGHCFKEVMVKEILAKKPFESIPVDRVYWFDDKDYSVEAKVIGVNFIHVEAESLALSFSRLGL